MWSETARRGAALNMLKERGMWKGSTPEAKEHASEMRAARAEDEARRERLKALAARAREKSSQS
jgi:hypothetical protein